MTQPTVPATARPGRVEAIDIFKFIVLFFMIQGHLFRAYLLPAIRAEGWYGLHEVLHGMVAPGFLFASGFGAFLAFHRKREQYIHFDRAFFTRLRRILFVIAVGYWLHLPFFSLRKTLAALTAGQATDLLRVDILQCIGASLIVFTLLAVIFKSERGTVAAVAVAAALFFLLPGMLRPLHLNPVVDPYFRYDPNYLTTLFPMFPWAGFLLLGCLGAWAFMALGRGRFFRLLLVAGLIIFPWYFLFNPGGKAELTLTGNLNKLGGVLLVLWFSDWLARRAGGPVVDIMKRAGRESLFVYVLHLFVIFSSFFHRGLNLHFQGKLTLWPAIGLTLLVQLVVFASSLLYGQVKDQRPRLWRVLFYSFWGLFLAVFILRPH